MAPFYVIAIQEWLDGKNVEWSVRACLARYVGRPFAEQGPFDPDQIWRRLRREALEPPPAQRRRTQPAPQPLPLGSRRSKPAL